MKLILMTLNQSICANNATALMVQNGKSAKIQTRSFNYFYSIDPYLLNTKHHHSLKSLKHGNIQLVRAFFLHSQKTGVSPPPCLQPHPL